MPAKASSFLTPTSPGSVAVTGVGFEPNLIFFIGSKEPDPQIANSTVLTEYSLYQGIACQQSADSSIAQCVISMWHELGTTAGNFAADGQMSQTACVHAYTSAGAVMLEGAVTSFDADGFTLNFSTVDASARRIKFLAFQLVGANIKLGSFTIADDDIASSGIATYDMPVTGVGFEPSAVVFLSGGQSFNSGSTDTYFMSFGVDMCGGDLSVNNEDANGQPVNARWEHRVQNGYNQISGLRFVNTTNHYWSLQTPAYNTDHTTGYLLSLDADGFTVQWDWLGYTGDTSTYYYLALGNCQVCATLFWRAIMTSNNTRIARVENGFEMEGALILGATPFSHFGGLGLAAAGFTSTAEVEAVAYYGFPATTDGPILANTVGRGTSVNSAPALATFTTDFDTRADTSTLVRRWPEKPGIKVQNIDDVGVTFYTTQSSFATTATSDTPECAYLALFLRSGATVEEECECDRLVTIDDMELGPNETHYMSIGHTTGVGSGEWTMKLFKDGAQITSQAIEVRESPTGFYTFEFINDGTHNSQWHLVVYETADPSVKYIQAWKVYKKIIEQGIKLIKSRMDSDGGFFQSSQGNDKN